MIACTCIHPAAEHDGMGCLDRYCGCLSPTGEMAKRITICQLCRKRIHKQRNGAWYHDRNSSESCRPGEGSERRAVPLEIEVAR